jgi:exodeoxyribonuclease VII large subunit
MLTINKEEIFTVSEVNSHIKHVIEGGLSTLFVEGEVANYTHHRSGHIYFSIKDLNSTLKCVFFRNYNMYLDFKPVDGDKVIVAGKITVYETGGQYQLNVTKMYSAGKGLLQAEFEKLKKKLSEEGLFDPAHKLPLPKFPERIGVITSPTAAAFQDICNVLTRRYPAPVYIYPALTQGEGAPQTLIAGIRYFNEHFPVDVILLGRGGGSQEDLFCFNDEQLARAIYASRIPIISGIGHEIDFTIADFVSDLRAPTPSAAAELAVPDKRELLQNLREQQNKLNMIINHKVKDKKIALGELGKRLQKQSPESRLQNFQQRLDEAVLKFTYFGQKVSRKKEEINSISRHFSLLMKKIGRERVDAYRYELKASSANLPRLGKEAILREQNRLSSLDGKLKALSPQRAFERGFAMLHKDKAIIKSVDSVALGDRVAVTLSDGVISCAVENKTKNGA